MSFLMRTIEFLHQRSELDLAATNLKVARAKNAQNSMVIAAKSAVLPGTRVWPGWRPVGMIAK
jgi:hypothetical protein